MNSEIINLVKELNNTIISNITDEQSIIINEKFMFLRGNYKKYYYISDYKFKPIINEGHVYSDTSNEVKHEESELSHISNEIENDEFVSFNILNKIENDVIYNEQIKQIPANLIYSIIILKVNEINDELYKTIIKIEEDEYFSKKYVFYYTEEELRRFYYWKERCLGNSFNSLLNQKENAKLLEDKDNSVGLKFMLRLLVKLPFIKANIESSHIKDFDEELDNIIDKIRNEEDRNSIRKISSQIFEFIDERDDINKAIEDYFDLCKGV
jgi:hypothetical protein